MDFQPNSTPKNTLLETLVFVTLSGGKSISVLNSSLLGMVLVKVWKMLIKPNRYTLKSVTSKVPAHANLDF